MLFMVVDMVLLYYLPRYRSKGVIPFGPFWTMDTGTQRPSHLESIRSAPGAQDSVLQTWPRQPQCRSAAVTQSLGPSDAFDAHSLKSCPAGYRLEGGDGTVQGFGFVRFVPNEATMNLCSAVKEIRGSEYGGFAAILV